MGTKQTKTQTTRSKKSTVTQPASIWRKHRKLWLWLLGILGGIVLLIAVVYVSFQVSPWPGSLFIRYFFDKGGRQTSAALEKYVPAGIASTINLQYRSN